MGDPLRKKDPTYQDAGTDWKKHPRLRELIQKNSEVSFSKQFAHIASDWSVILVASFIGHFFFHPALYPALAFLIATRQHALLILMHEGAHFRLSHHRLLNDITSDFLTAFPFLASTSWYRHHHAAHHRHLNTEQDPDWARKISLQEWQFPQSSLRLVRTFMKQIAVGGFEWIHLMILMGIKSPERRSAKVVKIVYYLAALTAIHWLNLWTELVLFWLVPLLFIFPSLQRFRSMTEHFGLERNHELTEARNTEAGPVESFCLSPHGTNYHLVHHLFPSLPHYNLRKVHRELSRFPLYAEKAHRNDSYLFSGRSVLRDLLADSPKKES